ncbi:hexosaminidase [Kwoniella heveanensis CBS 569]|nr:hexosaminidase [Kwoniella heveanensis CBS 569]
MYVSISGLTTKLIALLNLRSYGDLVDPLLASTLNGRHPSTSLSRNHAVIEIDAGGHRSETRSRLNIVPAPKYHTTGDGSTPICLASNFAIVFVTSTNSFFSADLEAGGDGDEGGRERTGIPDDLIRAAGRTQWNVRHHTMKYLSVQGGREFFLTGNDTSAAADTGMDSQQQQQQRYNFSGGHGPEAKRMNGRCQRYLSTLSIRITDSPFTSGKRGPRSIFEDSTSLPIEERLKLERYELDIPLNDENGGEGQAILSAPSALGVLRGLTTFEGLWYYLPPPRAQVRVQDRSSVSNADPKTCFNDSAQDSDHQGCPEGLENDYDEIRYAPFAPYHIRDQAAFGWRGLLLDTSRHFFSVDNIMRLLDTMSMVKLNIFHWHITDSNSFPLQLHDHPELAQQGAYSPEELYSEADVRRIVRYAGERGIDVLFEIDTPGHTASVAASHPDYIACNEAQPWARYAHQPPAGQLRFADEGVVNWTKRLFDSVAKLSASRYVSTGGDEINVRCMMDDEATVAALSKKGWTLDQALDVFTNATHAALRENGQTPVVWQEMVLDHGDMPSLKNDTIVEVWVNSSDATKVLDKGYRVVHAASDYFYLDCGHGSWIGKPSEGGHHESWCDPYKTWSKIYSFDPYEGVKGDQQHLILGGELSLWAEQTDETNLESTVWPRTAAMAEVFWTGSSSLHKVITPGQDQKASDPEHSEPEPERGTLAKIDLTTADWSSSTILRRMHDTRYRMVDRGIRATPLQPHWCALRPGAVGMSSLSGP